jgi:hopanoid biosynthesis associated protein HpnK
LHRGEVNRDQRMKQLVVTADDFGASVAVNEAVEQAHREGILTAASLMVAGDAMEDAVARARALLPALGIGLHLVLVEGRPVLPPEQLPALVGRDGRFRTDMVRMAFRIFIDPAARRQLRAEIEAQFAAFAATGLPLDHVNAHKHFHLHPTIAATLLAVGREYGMKAMRAPVESAAIVHAVDPSVAPPRIDVAGHWARRLRDRLRRDHLVVPDTVFGLAWSGRFDGERLRRLIGLLPEGLSEIYMHPATGAYPGSAPGYRHADELAALTDGLAQGLLVRHGVVRGPFARFTDGQG